MYLFFTQKFHSLLALSFVASIAFGIYAYGENPDFFAIYNPSAFAQESQIIPTVKTFSGNLDTILRQAKDTIPYQYNLRSWVQQNILSQKAVLKNIEHYRKDYINLLQKDPSASESWQYLQILENRIRDSKLSFRSSTAKAYLYLLHNINQARNTKSALPKIQKEAAQKAFETAEKQAKSLAFQKNQSAYFSAWQSVIAMEGLEKYSATNFFKIKERVEKELIEEHTLYFKAFVYGQYLFEELNKDKTLLLTQNLLHTKQKYGLSCEVNSARDIINFYRLQNKKVAITEDELFVQLPKEETLPSLKITPAIIDSGAIQNNSIESGAIQSGSVTLENWGDPYKAFVGSVNGRQSAHPSLFTGYWVYAPVIEPLIQKELRNKQVRAAVYSQDKIVNNLFAGNPTMVWYLKGLKNKSGETTYNFTPVEWKTKEGKDIKGYIGEHVAVIVGVKMSTEGRPSSFLFYEGNSTELQEMSLEQMNKLAEPFRQAIYID